MSSFHNSFVISFSSDKYRDSFCLFFDFSTVPVPKIFFYDSQDYIFAQFVQLSIKPPLSEEHVMAGGASIFFLSIFV